MDERFARDLLVGSGYSRDEASRKLRDGLPVLLPARGERDAITLTRVDGVWAERWAAGPGGKRVRVISPEHGKSGDEHVGKTGWLLEMDRSNGRAAVRFDGDPGPTEITACCLQDLAE
jgi:hypothetical protein